MPVRSVCLLKSSSAVTAGLQLCPGCEKPPSIGKRDSSALCSASGTAASLPPSFFPTGRGCGKWINMRGCGRTAAIPGWEGRWDGVLQICVGSSPSLPALSHPHLRKHHAGGGRGVVRCSQSPTLRGYAVTSSFPRDGGCSLKGVVIQHVYFLFASPSTCANGAGSSHLLPSQGQPAAGIADRQLAASLGKASRQGIAAERAGRTLGALSVSGASWRAAQRSCQALKHQEGFMGETYPEGMLCWSFG